MKFLGIHQGVATHIWIFLFWTFDMETKSRLVAARSWGEKGMGSEYLMGMEFPFGKIKNFWNLQ